MSTTPCGCQCKATDTALASEGLAFVPSGVPAPELAVSLPLVLVLTMVTVAMTLRHQRRRAWCILALRDIEPASRPTASPWWKFHLSPTERRIASAVRARALQIGAATDRLLPLPAGEGWGEGPPRAVE
jgi:hypothetical protein